MFKSYYYLTKPGIVYGNALTAAAGFLLASRGQVNWWLLVALVVGTSLVIASACVYNNYIDRDIDQLMDRTKRRALAKGKITGPAALIYATGLLMVGFVILVRYTNWLTVIIGLIALVDYVALYGWSKRRSVHGTLVGSISGAAPIAAGYTAVTNRFDAGAIILFAIMVLWQMPHFYAIAIRRANDYAAAKIPVLPLVSGVRQTKIQMIAYTAAFILAATALTIFGFAGYSYLVVMLAFGGWWLSLGLKGFGADDNIAWAKRVFGGSLVVLLALSVMLAVNSVLP